MEGTLKTLGKIISLGDTQHHWLWKGITWVSVFLAPIKPLMIAIGVLIAIDLILGIWAAIKSGEKITSRGISRTIAKIIAYNLAIISSHIMESYFAQGIPIVKIISGLIAITEFKSILENTTRMTGIDFWKVLIRKMTKSLPKKKPVKKSTRKKKKSRKKTRKTK